MNQGPVNINVAQLLTQNTAIITVPVLPYAYGSATN